LGRGLKTAKGLAKRSEVFNEILKDTLHDLAVARESFDDRWGRVAQAYAKVRRGLVPPSELESLSDVGEVFLGRVTGDSLAGLNLAQNS
jgi:hypothetical protein